MGSTQISEAPLTPEGVINLDDYPIGSADDPHRAALVERLRRDLDSHQYIVLPGFIRPEARERAVQQALSVRSLANDNYIRRNCYLQRSPDPTLPDDHPRNIFLDSSTHMLACDLLPADSPLKVMYSWAPMRRFVADIVGEDELYENEDLFQPVNVLFLETGDRSSWHFDSSNAFTMTLMLQAPESGGNFEIVPNTRSDDDENYEYVRSVMLGDESDAIAVGRAPGSLCIFRGCNSLHRVSEVEGERTRIMGVFVYETEPGVVGDPEVNETVYGSRVRQAGP